MHILIVILFMFITMLDTVGNFLLLSNVETEGVVEETPSVSVDELRVEEVRDWEYHINRDDFTDNLDLIAHTQSMGEGGEILFIQCAVKEREISMKMILPEGRGADFNGNYDIRFRINAGKIYDLDYGLGKTGRMITFINEDAKFFIPELRKGGKARVRYTNLLGESNTAIFTLSLADKQIGEVMKGCGG